MGLFLLGFVAVSSNITLPRAYAAGTAYSYTCVTGTIYYQPTGSDYGPFTFSSTVSISATAPATVAPSSILALTNVHYSVTVPSSIVDQLYPLGATSLSGYLRTFYISATNAPSTTATTVRLPATNVGPVTLTLGSSATITYDLSSNPGVSWTAGSTGTISFTPGVGGKPYNQIIITKVSLGSANFPNTFSITCTLASRPPAAFATTIIESIPTPVYPFGSILAVVAPLLALSTFVVLKTRQPR